MSLGNREIAVEDNCSLHPLAKGLAAMSYLGPERSTSNSHLPSCESSEISAEDPFETVLQRMHEVRAILRVV